MLKVSVSRQIIRDSKITLNDDIIRCAVEGIIQKLTNSLRLTGTRLSIILLERSRA